MGQHRMRSRPHFVPAVTGSANQVPSPGGQEKGHQDWALGPGRVRFRKEKITETSVVQGASYVTSVMALASGGKRVHMEVERKL